MNKKSCVFYFLGVLLILATGFASAAISIEKKAVTDTVITELDEPAIFEFFIKNEGGDDNFEIYSLADVDIIPVGSFRVAAGETEKVIVKIYPYEKVKERLDKYTFIYKIGGQISGVQEDKLTIRIFHLGDVFDININDVSLESSFTTAKIKNKVNFDFKEINAVFSSALFSQEETFSLNPYEEREVNITLDKDKIKGLIAGSYTYSTELKVDKASVNLNGQLRFAEKSSVDSYEKTSGLIIITKTIEKTNNGNIPVIAQITQKKDAISRLFTSFNIEPSNVHREGFSVLYNWQKEILPGQSLKVKIKTNWLFPLLLVVIIVVIVFLTSLYIKSGLIVKKKVKFVETKAGVLALKISLSVSAKKFVEKISIIDKVPAVMKVYEKYGEKPDRIDGKNNRVEWNIEALDSGETRMFSYLIYSKVGIVGKLELPSATAVYEKNNKICETKSNKAFFITEPAERIEEE